MTERRMWPCPHCDLIIEGETDLCPHCGDDTTKTLYAPPASVAHSTGRCLICRKPVLLSDQTCPHCGWELAPSLPATETPNLAEAAPKAKMSRWLTVGLPVLAVAVFSAIGVLIFNLADSGQEEIGNSYEGAFDIAGLTGEYDSFGVTFVIPPGSRSSPKPTSPALGRLQSFRD